MNKNCDQAKLTLIKRGECVKRKFQTKIENKVQVIEHTYIYLRVTWIANISTGAPTESIKKIGRRTGARKR